MRTSRGLVTLAAGVCLALLGACAPYYVPVEDAEDGGVALQAPSSRDGIPLLITTRLSRPAEVIAVLDVHVRHGRHDAALEILRGRAADVGADAVVGVSFAHGDGKGPLHLSGLAVRTLR